ncbi:MAG: MtrA protein [Mycobacterium sp.]|nr:MtrA protein [Mycobacterium sp.]
MHMIEASGLAKTYDTTQGPVEAVHGVDLHVDPGEIVGFLGPNGAGKTTTVRMLTTLLRPSGGSAVIAGHDLLSDPTGVRLRLGYVSQTGGTKPTATVRDELVLQAQLYRMSPADAEARADELIRDLDLAGLEQRMCVTLSGGQRRRVDVALGLVHQPEVLFLDEPSANLDPPGRMALWNHIRRLRDEHGTTVFLSTHYLDEADHLCDRVLIIDRGQIIAEDSPDQLKARIGHDTVTVDVAGDTDRAREVILRQTGVESVTVTGQALRVACHHADRMLTVILHALVEAGVQVESVVVVRPTLDDVFMAITGHNTPTGPEPIHL